MWYHANVVVVHVMRSNTWFGMTANAVLSRKIPIFFREIILCQALCSQGNGLAKNLAQRCFFPTKTGTKTKPTWIHNRMPNWIKMNQILYSYISTWPITAWSCTWKQDFTETAAAWVPWQVMQCHRPGVPIPCLPRRAMCPQPGSRPLALLQSYSEHPFKTIPKHQMRNIQKNSPWILANLLSVYKK